MSASQCERVLAALKFVPLTQAVAAQQFGVGRLAARIRELRERGHSIHTETVTDENRFGERVRYARYHLITEKKQSPAS